jgi:hypothetical protein
MADPSAIAGQPLPGIAGASGFGQAGLGLEGVGLAGSLVAGYFGSQAQQGISQSSQNIAALQQQANQVKWTQARLGARRQQMEVLRNEQRARSLALSNATNQGAQFGSGLQGGYGQIQGESGNNLLGINQNLALGAQMNTINQSISGQEMNIAKYQGQAAMWQGIGGAGAGATSLGSSIVSSATNPSGSLFS